MSIPKLVGLEQEYAITVAGDFDLSAFHASCLLVNAYARHIGLRRPGLALLWDYGHETPHQDVRGPMFGKSTGREIMDPKENLLINACLPNGARYYTDHAHPEYSTPECLSARQVLACDKAGEKIARASCLLVKQDLPESRISLYKNNMDYQGHSYGCHENYLLAAEPHEELMVKNPDKALKILVPFLVTRQIFTGAGKVGGGASFQVSQRSDFMETIFGLETMFSRPIVNTRKEHHADPARFRRLHLIIGDANMCQFAGFLKIGASQLVLAMIEDDFPAGDYSLKDPVKALRAISRRFDAPVELADGRNLTAAQLQRELLTAAEKYHQGRDDRAVPEAESILKAWALALDGLENLCLSSDYDIKTDDFELRTRLDWVLKLWLINRRRQGKKMDWDHPQLKILDLQYHRIDDPEGIFHRLEDQGLVETILDRAEIDRMVQEPPMDTRAYFRGRCLEKFAREINLVNWEVIGFDQGEVYRMVPLLNPLSGTRKEFGVVLDRARTARELIGLMENKTC